MSKMQPTTILSDFADTYPTVFYESSEIIVHPGEAPDDMYVLEAGTVHQLDISSAGSEIVLNVFAPPAFLSVFWLFDAVENRFTYKAQERVTAKKIPCKDMQRFLLTHPEFTYDTMRRLVRGLDGFVTRLTHQMYGSAEQKIITELIIEARRFHKHSTTNIALKVGVNDLAARTGLARETVSRNIQKLISSNLIEKSGSTIIIPNLSKLEEAL